MKLYSTLKLHGSWLSLAILPVVIFLHFMFFRVWGYPLTIAPFAVIILVALYFQISLERIWGWGVGLLFLPFIGLFWAMTSGENTDITQYFRTYALWSFAVLAVLVSFKSPPREISHEFWPLEKIAFACLAITCAFSIVQVVIFFNWGSSILYNPFGEHQYLGPYDVSRFAASYVIRATGLYLEPSFNAFIVISLYAICLLGRFNLCWSSGLTLLALFAIQSTTGLIAFIAIWASIMLHTQFEKNKDDRKVWRKAGIINLALALLITYSGGVIGVNGASRIAELNKPSTNCASRIAELNKPSTSGYYRIVAPLDVLRDVLVNAPLGKPLGQIEGTLSSYQLLNGTERGKTLDNGMYLLVFYFGWMGIAFLSFLFFRLAKLIYSHGNLNEIILLVYIFLSMQFSGGILLPEYILMLVMVLYRFKLSSYSS